MNVKKFIDRPLLSIVINVMVVAVGIIALTRLPIEKYPDIAPPTVYLWASYPGASAETVQKSVLAPLEQAINGVDNMTYMKSSAQNGSASISIFFKQGTNADMAAVNVQNRVVQAQAQLPAEVLKMGVAVEKQQPGQLRILALESPGGTYDENFLSNYFYNNLRPAILRIQGVGKCEVWGGQYTLRIWLKPEAMVRYGIVPSDITTLLEEQNVEASIGSIGENTPGTFQYTLRYTGRKQDVREFENLILRSNQTGEELRLKDVADLELGQSDYAYSNHINGHPGVMGSVSQVAGSNATRINQDIDRLIKEVEQTMPKDIRIVTFDNTNDFLFASIREVVFTLLLAIVLVLVVVYLFVQDFRATLIPALGIIVSLIGTFAFMAVAGFSINMLTLFALVLVIGTVVDDSIVVVEAVQTRISLNPSPSPKGEGSDYSDKERAADAGYSRANYILGSLEIQPYDFRWEDFSDPNTEDSYQAALNYYKKAADVGLPEGLYALGDFLKHYNEISGDVEEALKNNWNENWPNIYKISVPKELRDSSYIWGLIQKAADNGIVEAQYQMLSNDRWCEENANKDVAVAQFGMGLRHDSVLNTSEYPILGSLHISSSEDYAIAAMWYQKAAENGLDVAQWRLGELYARGLGVEKNIDKAISWRKKAAEQGSVIFQLIMAMSYNYGEIGDLALFESYGTSELHMRSWGATIPEDPIEVDYWLRKVSHHELTREEKNTINGNSMYCDAMYLLAEDLQKIRQTEKAVYWYQRVIEMGDEAIEMGEEEFYMPYAASELGRLYMYGECVEEDFAKAKMFLEKGVDGGVDEAACYLGMMYLYGLGVEKNDEKAKELFLESLNFSFSKTHELIPAMPCYLLSRLYFFDKQYDKSIDYLKRAVSGKNDKTERLNAEERYSWLNKYSTEAYNMLGVMYAAGLEFEQNEQNNNKGIELILNHFTSTAKIYLDLAKSATTVAEKEAALMKADKVYADLAATMPTYEDIATYLRARLMHQINPDIKAGKAKPFYEKYAQMMESFPANVRTINDLNTTLAEAYNYLAVYYLLNDKMAQAKDYARKLQEIQPDNDAARQILELK